VKDIRFAAFSAHSAVCFCSHFKSLAYQFTITGFDAGFQTKKKRAVFPQDQFFFLFFIEIVFR
jgi:hypothetical protein